MEQQPKPVPAMELDATASVPFGQDSSAEHASFLGKVLATVQAAQEYADTTLVDENPYHYAGWEKDLEKGLGGGVAPFRHIWR